MLNYIIINIKNMSFVEKEEFKVVSKNKHKRVKTTLPNQMLSSPYSSKKTLNRENELYAFYHLINHF